MRTGRVHRVAFTHAKAENPLSPLRSAKSTQPAYTERRLPTPRRKIPYLPYDTLNPLLPFDRILAGRLVGLVRIIRFPRNFLLKSEWMRCKCTQKIKVISQGIQKLSHFLGFFLKIFKICFFGWLGHKKLIWFDLVSHSEHVHQV